MRHVRPSTPADVQYLGPRLRQADVEEIKGVTGMSPVASLSIGLVKSDPCLTLLAPDDQRPIGMLGVVPQEDRAGLIWMHCTDDLPRYSMTFLRNCKPVLDQLFQRYAALYNWADARNALHVRWLRWMGFVFINRQHIGEENIPAFHFITIKEAHHVWSH